MAEFLDVIRQTKRICKSVNGNCGRCLMGEFSCPNNARLDSTDEQEFIDFANAVMSWAAKHPEPVYPTFAEWLNSIGVTISDRPFPAPNIPVYVFQVNAKMFDPIPADIAEKLGIEPKGV